MTDKSPTVRRVEGRIVTDLPNLIDTLEKALKHFRNNRVAAQCYTLSWLINCVETQGVPSRLLLPLKELCDELTDQMGGYDSTSAKPLSESRRLAVAAAAITLAKDAGETIGTSRQSQPGPTATKAARIVGSVTARELLNHRSNLVGVKPRARDAACLEYRLMLAQSEMWIDLTPSQKVDQMLEDLRAIT